MTYIYESKWQQSYYSTRKKIRKIIETMTWRRKHEWGLHIRNDEENDHLSTSRRTVHNATALLLTVKRIGGQRNHCVDTVEWWAVDIHRIYPNLGSSVSGVRSGTGAGPRSIRRVRKRRESQTKELGRKQRRAKKKTARTQERWQERAESVFQLFDYNPKSETRRAGFGGKRGRAQR